MKFNPPLPPFRKRGLGGFESSKRVFSCIVSTGETSFMVSTLNLDNFEVVYKDVILVLKGMFLDVEEGRSSRSLAVTEQERRRRRRRSFGF